ncbi:MAG: helix-turn-helix transcriptional regulator [Chromatiaceae bacterium]|nr:helix-turn-helix transcriptional regulator [Chromatiaceae bacterium]
MQKVKLNDGEIKRLSARFRRAMKRENHTQKQVETITGVGQYQVSRIINGQFSTLNTSVRKICKYADICLGSSAMSKQQIEEDLIASVLDLWDGSVLDGEGIIGLLEKLKKYRENAVGQKIRCS